MVEFWILRYCTPWPVREFTESFYHSQEGAARELAALASDGREASVSKVDVPTH